MKRFLKKIIPKQIFSLYHLFLAYIAAAYYGFPSRKMFVVGVTGTTGKSTTAYMLSKIFEEAGYAVGMTSTFLWKAGNWERLNNKKMTMLGRFQTQKFLRQMVKVGCQIAIIETTSEGVKQFRHKGINYDTVVFTNLSPEHIESHGSFENYKKAKGKLLEHVKNSRRKRLNAFENRIIKKTSIVNLDDEHAEYFLSFRLDKIYGFTTREKNKCELISEKYSTVVADHVEERVDAVTKKPLLTFHVGNVEFSLRLFGKYNISNALGAITAALALGIDLSVCQHALEKITGIAGRMEIIDKGQPFLIIVDFAFEPKAMAALYSAVEKIRPKRVIHVTGSAGGGRDASRRPILGELVGKRADVIIVTNEDPYDDDPLKIMEQVAAGAERVGKVREKNLFLVLDRRDAIRKALEFAQKGDLVLITGKGAEQAMAVKEKLVPWDDRKVAREELEKISTGENIDIECQ